MPRSRELERFWHLCFERPSGYPVYPSGDPNGKEQHSFTHNFNSMADVEACLWLHYGVEMNLFEEADAKSILNSNTERIRCAMLEVSEVTWLPPILRYFCRRASKDFSQFLNARYTDRLAPEVVNGIVLNMLFNQAARTFSDPALAAFSDITMFGPERAWSELMVQQPNPERVRLRRGTSVDVLLAGYVSALEHMQAIDELLRYCADEFRIQSFALRDAQGGHTFELLRNRVKLIHNWRVKLDEPSVRNRFIEVTYKLTNCLQNDAQLKAFHFDSNQFWSS